MEVFRFFHIMVLSTIFLQLLTFENATAFKDFMADPDSSSNLETNEEVCILFINRLKTNVSKNLNYVDDK